MAASVREGRLGGVGLHCDCDCDQDYKMTDTIPSVYRVQYSTGPGTRVPGTVYTVLYHCTRYLYCNIYI
jgi:hypothetical protein